MPNVLTPCAELVNGDMIRDKAGNEWAVTDVDQGPVVFFWLTDPKTGVRTHYLQKPHDEQVEVVRPETMAEKHDRLDGDFPEQPKPGKCDGTSDLDLPEPSPTTEEAVAEVAEALGGEVVTTVTADEQAEVDRVKTSGQPHAAPPFDELTDVEKRQHLYLFHGTYAFDVKTRAKLIELHDEVHAAALEGPTPMLAHTHDGELPA